MKKKRQFNYIKFLTIVLAVFALGTARYFYVKTNHGKHISGHIYTDTAKVLSNEGGLVRQVCVQENQIVKKGDLLVKLDKALLKTELDEMIIRIERENLKLKLFKFYENRALDEYIAAKKDIDVDKEKVDFKFKELEEKQMLYQIQEVSIKLLKAKENSFKSRIANKNIFSGFDGKISKINIFENTFVNKNDNIFEITHLTNAYMDLSIHQKDKGKFNFNDEKSISIISYPDKNFKAKVVEIKPIDEFRALVKFKIDQEENAEKVDLISGMKANLKYE
ncbi:MAG: hypothetical protein A3F40_04885 [Chlamydiae bacterium RIFCSPHIGHO2_12_FULL_27_8]|nr:MAG: hypothetical protein A3F40_04885 [Chlamydiae bacterium RIFCSPHIGHO2_12_FULL_27_8]